MLSPESMSGMDEAAMAGGGGADALEEDDGSGAGSTCGKVGV